MPEAAVDFRGPCSTAAQGLGYLGPKQQLPSGGLARGETGWSVEGHIRAVASCSQGADLQGSPLPHPPAQACLVDGSRMAALSMALCTVLSAKALQHKHD